MKHIGIVGRFAEEDALITLQKRCLDDGVVRAHPLALPYLNIAGWLVPPDAVPLDVMKDIPPALPKMQFDFQPIIDLHRSLPLLAIEACVNHIINEWHFRIHKSFELPYLAADGNDVPKRWRPRVYFGQAQGLNVESPKLPATLCCTSLVLYDYAEKNILAEHQLSATDAIPW